VCILEAVTRSRSLAASVHACATDTLTLAADSVDTVTDSAGEVAELTLDDDDDSTADAVTHVATGLCLSLTHTHSLLYSP